MTDYTDLGFDKNFSKVADANEQPNGGEAITVPDNSVTSEKIRDEAVTNNKIKDFNWSKGRGGIISIGGQDNLSGSISVNRADRVSGETMHINKNGMSFPGGAAYRAWDLKSTANVISADGPTNIDAFYIRGTGEPCFYLISFSVTIETTTWDATNYCTVEYYVTCSAQTSKVYFGEIGNTANLKNIKLTLANTMIVYSSSGDMDLYTYKKRTGVVGNPTATITERSCNVFSMLTPITFTNMTSGYISG